MTDLTKDSKTNIALLRELSAKVNSDNKILEDMCVVQGILEAGLRNSPPSSLALKYNNLFGIKGVGTGKIIDGKRKTSISLPTHEWYPNRGMIEVDQMFAVNESVEDSILQHRSLLHRPRYAKVLTAKTFAEAALEIRKAGYATDVKYTQLLISIYNKYCGDKK